MRITLLSTISTIALLTLSVHALAGGLGKREAMYVGGTATFPERTVGEVSTNDEKIFTFEYKEGVEYQRNGKSG
jgi:hypothetical protein